VSGEHANRDAETLRSIGLGADDTFSAVAMSVVFFFLEDPIGVLRECRRVLRDGCRELVAVIEMV
jgi:ubiquinone/menaquinone biosynthesis C-methylase UbiE